LNPDEKFKVSWKYSILPGFTGYLLHIISFQAKMPSIAVSQLMINTSQHIINEYGSKKIIKDPSITMSGISYMHQVQIRSESVIVFSEKITQECNLKFQDRSSYTKWDFDLEFIVWYAPTPAHFAHQILYFNKTYTLSKEDVQYIHGGLGGPQGPQAPITLPINENIGKLIPETYIELIKTQVALNETYIEIPFMELFAA